MVQEISHRPLIAEDQVRAPVSPCGFVVDRVALGQVFLRVLRLPPPLALSFYRGPPYAFISGGMYYRPIGGRSSETWSHSINMDNKNVFTNSNRYQRSLVLFIYCVYVLNYLWFSDVVRSPKYVAMDDRVIKE
jgi:hypothetical protein